jgi:hypothetical protein
MTKVQGTSTDRRGAQERLRGGFRAYHGARRSRGGQSAHNASGDLCQFAINPNIYAKIVVDSVNLASRTLFLRLGLDPNCGFRSFAAGIPTG